MSKCEICGGSGYHKLSCGNNTARVGIPMNIIIEDELEPARRVLGDGVVKESLTTKNKEDENSYYWRRVI